MMTAQHSLFCLALAAVAVGRGPPNNCGVQVPRVPGAPVRGHQPLTIGNPDEIDVEDALFSHPSKGEYKQLRRACANGEQAGRCLTFGIQQWNLSYYVVLEREGTNGKPCQADYGELPRKCGDEIVCKNIDGQNRIVGATVELTRERLEALSRLPHLFGLTVNEVPETDFLGLSLPDSLRIVHVHLSGRDGEWAALARLLREQGQIQSVFVQGRQDLQSWQRVDLAELCGLDLLHFNGFVVDTGPGIPECWSKMTHLQQFYCTNCMMTSPPTALRGLQSLRSFVAFRQSEMVPCVVSKLADSKSCKPSWETKNGFKEGGLRESSGQYGDFQEGPSFLCPQNAYAFPFKEFVDLGWTNLRKLWLDGNFLTGPIPENIATVWPSLQSLDLYDNQMDGPIPESLGALNWVKLQLHDNNFSGVIPSNIMTLLEKQQDLALGLSSNPELLGCAPKRHVHQGKKWWKGVTGTKIKPCDGQEL